MKIKYRYTKAGKSYDGQIQLTADMTGHHEVVRSVVQKIANETGEKIFFSMLGLTGNFEVGIDCAEPQDVKDNGQRSIDAIEISEDGKSWNSIHLSSRGHAQEGS